MDTTITKTNDISKFINECERLAAETGEPHFVLNWKTLHEIHKRTAETKEDKRDADLEEILDEEEFSIGNIQTVLLMPSMQIYYDTVSKILDSEERTDWAINKSKKLGFELNSIYNFLEEDEKIPFDKTKEFSMRVNLEDNSCVIMRISPNLMIKVVYISEYNTKEIYSGFFSTNKIIESMTNNIKEEYITSVMREMKLIDLLD